MQLWLTGNEVGDSCGSFQVRQAVLKALRHMLVEMPRCLFLILAYFAERLGGKR